jgi:hypothetical protein
VGFFVKKIARNCNYYKKNLDVKISRWREQPHLFGHGNGGDEVKTMFYQRADKCHIFYCYPGVSAMTLEAMGSAMAGRKQPRRTEPR